MAVYSYNGGMSSIAKGSYGTFAVRKGQLKSIGQGIVTSAKSFTEGTPSSTLFEPVNRNFIFNTVYHSSGYNGVRTGFNTLEPYNNNSSSTTSYYSAYNTVFEEVNNYNTSTPSGDYWAHAWGYTGSDLGNAIVVDTNRNVWVAGTANYCTGSVATITASLTPTGNFGTNTTSPSSGTNDDGRFDFTIPWNHNIFGLNTNTFAIYTNSWVNFDTSITGNTATSGFSATFPPSTNIQIGAGQTSCQRLYYGVFGSSPNRTARFLFEGTNATTGTLGSPNMVWELILYENAPKTFDVQIGTWTPPSPAVSGLSDGTVYFGTFTPAANSGFKFTTDNLLNGNTGNTITLTKYTSDGQYEPGYKFSPTFPGDGIRVLTLGRNGNDFAEGLRVDKNNNLYLLYTSNSLGATSFIGDNEIGVIKINPNISQYSTDFAKCIIWNKTYGTTSGESAADLDIDSNGDLYLSGFTAGSGQGSNDFVVLKINGNTGSTIWKRTYGGTGSDLSGSIKVSSDGFLYIWGQSATTPLAGTTTDWALLKVNSSTGAIVWQKHFTASAATVAQVFEGSLEIDELGNIYTAGYAATSFDDYFIAKFDSSGNLIWSNRYQGLGVVDAPTKIKYKNKTLYVAGQDGSQGYVYQNIPARNVSSSGFGSTWNVASTNGTTYIVALGFGGGNYALNNTLKINGDEIGGKTPTNDISITVTGVTSGRITSFTASGTPAGVLYESFSAGILAINSDTGEIRQQLSIGSSDSDYALGLDVDDYNDVYLTGSTSTTSLSGLSLATGTNTLVTKVFLDTASPAYSLSGSAVVPKVYSYTQPSYYYNAYDIVFDNTIDSKAAPFFLQRSSTNTKQLYSVVGQSIVYYTPEQIVFGTEEVYNSSLTKLSSSSNYSFSDSNIGNTPTQQNISLGTISPSATYSFVRIFNGKSERSTYFTPIEITIGDMVANPPELAILQRINYSLHGNLNSIESYSTTYSRYAPSVISSYDIAFDSLIPNYINNTSSVGKVSTTTTSNIVIISSQISLGSISGAAQAFGANPPENTQLFDVTGTYSNLKNTIAYQGTGGITTSGAANVPNTYRIIGRNDTAYQSSYNIVFGSEENINQMTVGSARYIFAPSGIFGSGTFTASFSDLNGSRAIVYYVPILVTILMDANALAARMLRYAGKSATTPFGATDIIFEQIEANAPPTSPKFISSSIISETNSYNAFISVSEFKGSGQVTQTQAFAYNGTGGFSTSSAASLVYGSNPPENTQLFSITDTLIEKQTDVASGNGTLTISGSQTQINVYRHIGYSSIAYYNAQQIVFAEGETFYPTEYKITGTASYKKQSSGYSGSGTFSGTDGAAQVYSPQTPENIQLFSITGSCIESYSPQTPENIQLFTIASTSTNSGSRVYTGFSPIEYYSPYEIVFGEGELFYPTTYKLTGVASKSTTPRGYNGTGTTYLGSYNPYEITVTTRTNSYLTTFNLFTRTSRNSTNIIATRSTAYTFGSVYAVGNVAFISNPPENIQLFQIYGGATLPPASFSFVSVAQAINITGTYSNLKIADAWSGTSRFVYYEPYQIVFGEGELFYTTEFKLSNSSTINSVEAYSGSGTFSATDGAAQVYSPQTPENIQLFSITGSCVESYSPQTPENIQLFLFTDSSTSVGTRVYVGSSPYAYYSPEQIVFGDGESFYPTTYKVLGNSVYTYVKPPYSGSGSLFTTDGAAQVYSAQTPENIQLFSITGAYSDFKSTNDYEGLESISITGTYSNLKSADAWIGTPRVAYYEPYQIVFGENELFYATEFKLLNAATFTNTEAYNASGFFSTIVGGAEAFGTNPPENTQLFSISDSYTNFKSVSILNGLGNTNITGAALQSRLYPNYIGSSPIEYYSPYEVIFGEGELFYPTTYKLTGVASKSTTPRGYNGTGTFSSTDGSAIVFGANPPENIQLFQIYGGANLPPATFIHIAVFGNEFTIGGGRIAQEIYIYNGYSSIAYYSPEQIVFGEGELFYPTEYKITDTAKYNETNVYSGSGTFSATDGAGLVYSPQTPENIQLFSITGSCVESYSPQTPENIQLFSITGAYSNLKIADAWSGTPRVTYYEPYQIVFGEGELFYTTEFKLSNTSIIANVEAFSGSGSLFTTDGAAQVYSAQTPENIQLFSITGAYSDLKSIDAWNGTGQATISGAGSQSRLYPNYIGSSPYAYYSPEQIVFGEGELFYPTTYKLTGVADKAFLRPPYIGTGTFSSTDGSAIVFGANPPENIQLFQIYGGATLPPATFNFVSVAQAINITGTESAPKVFKHAGYSSIVYYSPEQIVFGEGELFYPTEYKITDTARYRDTITYSGSGTFSATDGAGLVYSPQTPENIQLFSISGVCIESYSPQTPENIQLFSITGAYSNLKSIDAWVGTPKVTYYEPYQIVFGEGELFYATEFKLTNSATIVNVEAFSGSGSLFTTVGAAQSTTTNPPENIQLFQIYGGATLPPATFNFVSVAQAINITGGYTNLKIADAWVGTPKVTYYEPYEIIFGEGELFYATEFKLTNSAIVTNIQTFSGSGSLFTTDGAAQVYSAQTPENIQLFSITGAYSDLKIADAWNGTGQATISGAGSQSRLYPNYIGSSPYAYYSPEQIVFGEGELFYPTTYKLTGVASKSTTPRGYNGSGSLFTTDGAAQVYSPNTPENIQLFSITGAYSDLKSIDAWNGTGQATISGAALQSRLYPNYIGSSPIEYYSPYEVIFGEGELFYPTTLQLTGVASKSTTPRGYNGTGTFSSTVGSAIVFGANPPENIQLFDFDNQFSTIIIKSTDSWNGTGQADIIGSAQTPRTKVYSGYSYIAYYSPEQIVFGDGESFYPTEYKITGSASHRTERPGYSASGTFSTIVGSAETFGANTPENTQLFSIGGDSIVRLRDWIYISPEVLINPNDIIFDNHIYNYFDIQINYVVWNSNTNQYSSSNILSYSSSYSGSGTFSTASGLAESFSVNTLDNIQLFSISGNASVPQPARIIGSGQFSTANGAAIAFGVNPPENIQLFSITGASADSETDVYAGSASIEIVGAYSDLKSTDAWSGSGQITITSEEIQDTFGYAYAGQVTPLLVGLNGTASVTFNPPENTQLFDIQISSASSTTIGLYTGSGTFSTASGLAEVFVANPQENTQLFNISGNADVPQPARIIGSGQFSTANGAAIAFGVNPPENIQLFTIAGVATESQTDITSGSGAATFSGTLVERNTESYNGSGSLFVTDGAAIAFGANPPENTQLFDITATHQIRTTTGVYNASVSYEFTGGYSNLQNVDVWSGSGTTNISGSGSYRFETGIYTGAGSLFTAGGLSESFGANPPENTQLFSLAGSLVEKQTDVASGSGSLFTASGVSQSTATNPPENIQIFSITGAYSDLKSTDAWSGSGTTTISGAYSNLKNTSSWNGSGTISISGTATESQTDITSGSGSLFTASGVSQSTATNPPENIQIFSITGAYSDLKSTDAWSGSGTINISGSATAAHTDTSSGSGLVTITGSLVERGTDVEIGSGTLFTTGGHVEVFGANPPENIQLFNVAGAYSDLKSTDVWIGSGTLSTFSGASEAYSAQTPENIQLVDISVSSIERVNYSVVSSGNLFTEISSTASVTFNPPENIQIFSITGTYSDLKSTDAWSGFGTLSTFSGAAEAFGANPPENTMLFVSSGNLVERVVSNNIGSVTTEITGSATNIQFRASYAGSGTANINGAATVAISSKNIQSGSLFTAGGLSESFGANTPENIQLFNVAGGYSDLKSTDVWSGSGTLFATSGSVEAFGANPPESTELFVFSGEGEEKFETSSYRGMGTIHVEPNADHSFSKIAEFDAGTIDVDVSIDESVSYGNFTGSGSLFGFVSYQESATFVPAVGIVIPEQTPLGSTTLFTLYGTATVQFGAHAYQGNGIININVNAVVRTQLPEKVFVTIV